MIEGLVEHIGERQITGLLSDTEHSGAAFAVRARLGASVLAEIWLDAEPDTAPATMDGKASRAFRLLLGAAIDVAARTAVCVEARSLASPVWVGLPRLVRKIPILERVRSKAWAHENTAIREPEDPRTMLNDEELRMLRWLTARYYRGVGGIIDGGAFLGGSTVALCKGLRDAGWVGCRIDSYDLFVAEAYAAEIYGEDRFVAGESTRPLYDEGIAPYSDFVCVHEGDISTAEWLGGDIEILFLDCLKTSDVNDSCILNFFPHLIPNHSLVIQQDFLWNYLPWIHISMESLYPYFEILCDTEYNSVVFLNTKRIPQASLRSACWSSMSVMERAGLMDKAIGRWQGQQRQFLVNAKRSAGLGEGA